MCCKIYIRLELYILLQDNSTLFYFLLFCDVVLGREHEAERVTGREELASSKILFFTGFESSEEPQLHSLICSFVMTGRRLVNFNFWFQKLSNTAQMRNQFSQLPWLCGEKDRRHWWTARHMTESGISSVGPCCHHLNYRLPLVIYLYSISFSDTSHI